MNGQVIKDDIPITSLEDWEHRAGPKRQIQWKDGRSAKECAKAWLASPGEMPAALRLAVESHPDFGTIKRWTAEPESLVRFDTYRGEPANIDVLVHAQDEVGPFIVVVEAKADETFGETIERKIGRASARLKESPRSKGLPRIQGLTRALLDKLPDDPNVKSLRYQLLTASAAALAEAERHKMDRAVVLIHEFKSSLTDDEKRSANERDFQQFLSMLNFPGGRTEDRLLGPTRVHGDPIVSNVANLYLGKVISEASH